MIIIAVQTTPFESRDVFGILDSLLQIDAIRNAIDAFMEQRMNCSSE